MKMPHYRWIVCGLLFLLSVINYIDRQTLSILIPTIQADLHLSDQQYGNVVSLFLCAYTISYLVSGRIVDALGSRLSLGLFVGFWSFAQLATGFTRSVGSLGFFRFLLGLGEAGGYTASPKIVAEWFPPKDRGLAVGIYGAGASVGATLAPLIIIAISARFGWRSAFFFTGGLGLVFAVLWLWIYRDPPSESTIRRGKQETLSPTRLQAPAPQLTEGIRWRMIMKNPGVWALMGARLLTDPVWYFFQFWMPKYLHSVRGFGQQELSTLWLIFLAADVGFVASGFIAGYLIRRGRAPRTARLWVMLGGAALVPLAPMISMSQGSFGVFAVSIIVVLGHTAWLATISTFVIDYIPARVLGTAFGFIAAGSAVGGIVMNQAVVWAVESLSYGACFNAMVLLHPIALLIVWRYTQNPWREST